MCVHQGEKRGRGGGGVSYQQEKRAKGRLSHVLNDGRCPTGWGMMTKREKRRKGNRSTHTQKERNERKETVAIHTTSRSRWEEKREKTEGAKNQKRVTRIGTSSTSLTSIAPAMTQHKSTTGAERLISPSSLTSLFL